jgi:signal transduction histidine kinase
VATTPPTLRQRQFTLVGVVVLFIAVAAVGPFAAMQWLRVTSFVPAVAVMNFAANLVTAALLFTQFSITSQRSLLVLANGYLFSALIVIPWCLTFPGAIAPLTFPTAGLQSTPWLYIFWTFGFSAAVVGYAYLKKKETEGATERSTRPALRWSVFIVISVVCGLTWGVTAGNQLIPSLFLNEIEFSPLAHPISAICLFTCTIALTLLWARCTSVLDLWLMVAISALLLELIMVTMIITGRFSVGFYASGALSVIVSTSVLVALLTETKRLYRTLQRDRKGRRTDLETVVAKIAQEVRQPLTGIVTMGAAAKQFLEQSPPDVESVKDMLDQMISASFQANEAFKNSWIVRAG